MRKITLTDGTTYELDWCNGDKGIFFANLITDADFIELVTKFSNPDLTSTMTVSFGDDDNPRIYEGYTMLKSIAVDDWRTGTTMVSLVMPNTI